MSTHRPYDDWILEEAPLSQADSRKLARHLADCEECRSLADGWERARHALIRPSMIGPRPGFRERWSLRQAAGARAPGKGGWFVLLASGGASLFGAGLTAWGLASLVSAPSEALQAWIRQLVAVSLWYRVVRDIVEAFSQTVPSSLMAGLGLAVVVAWVGLIAVWLASVRRIAFQGVQS